MISIMKNISAIWYFYISCFREFTSVHMPSNSMRVKTKIIKLLKIVKLKIFIGYLQFPGIENE